PRNTDLSSDDSRRIAEAFAQAGIPSSRLFHAIESVTQASLAKAEQRLQLREREEQDGHFVVVAAADLLRVQLRSDLNSAGNSTFLASWDVCLDAHCEPCPMSALPPNSGHSSGQS